MRAFAYRASSIFLRDFTRALMASSYSSKKSGSSSLSWRLLRAIFIYFGVLVFKSCQYAFAFLKSCQFAFAFLKSCQFAFAFLNSCQFAFAFLKFGLNIVIYLSLLNGLCNIIIVITGII